MIYICFYSEGITIQGIPQDSLEDYESREPAVVATPNCIKRLGARCESITILWVDSWRVKCTFKSNNGVTYEVLSIKMHELSTWPKFGPGISFEQYSTVKKCLGGVDVEVSVNNGIATFKGGYISSFTIRELGEPYCMIPGDHLKLLNKFLGATINSSMIAFCKHDKEFLFSIDKEYYCTDLQLNLQPPKFDCQCL